MSYRAVHCSAAALFVAGTSTLAWFATIANDGYSDAPWMPLISIAAVIVSFQLLNLGVVWGRSVAVKRMANGLLIACYVALMAYRLTTGFAADFFFVGANFSELFFSESATMVWGAAPTWVWVAAATCVLGTLIVGTRTAWLERWPHPRRRHPVLAATLLAYFLLLATPLYRANDLTNFVRSGFDFVSRRHAYLGADTDVEFPYVSRGDVAPEVRPNIVLLMMESMNGLFVERTHDGRAYTPVLNARLSEGVHVPRFYANSVQTVRGQLATLCSLVPALWRKVATDHHDLRLHCLPSVLEAWGYETWFIQGARSLQFDDTGHFMKRLGFRQVRAGRGDDDSPWGLSDEDLYRQVFADLDDRKACQRTPCFVTIATIAHHFPFDRTERLIHPQPTNRAEHFANSLHVADAQLRVFFEQLQARPEFDDAIVVITADHGFPAGEHGSTFNERGFYEDNFRAPLWLRWPRLAPQRIEHAASQLDIAPTLLALLGGHADNHFMGRSIFQPGEPTIPLLQPYGGTQVAIVRYPDKYVTSLRGPGPGGSREYLFNLREDPAEQHNMIGQPHSANLVELRAGVAAVHLHQRLIGENRIWPR